ncbi:MAG: hypothetical protein DMG28_18340 [Acidobacteria bacterium]|nr:MAG: hypothetical protein DMG28_18340 [Acidobacteriota bacterium]
MQSPTVCLAANTLYDLEFGGHFWVYLNWALGLRALGCRVIWLEGIAPSVPLHEAQTKVAALQSLLQRYGLAQSVALCSWNSKPLTAAPTEGCLDIEAAAEADLLLNLAYSIPPEMVKRFKRSALVDIDPGRLQIWMSEGQIGVAPHDLYFTIGETVGQPDAKFPDLGLKWEYTPPCVSLDRWAPSRAREDAPFTTLTNWYDGWMEYDDQSYADDKRTGFLPFLCLPRLTGQTLELVVGLGDDEDERLMLRKNGWHLREPQEVAGTPWDYQRYIQDSLGEFSCVRPSCVRLQNAWISDRTLCYLASGKPAVVQHTGPSRFLPEGAGLFRFRDLPQAVRYLNRVVEGYEHQCRLARMLTEEYFDARKVAAAVLDRALA